MSYSKDLFNDMQQERQSHERWQPAWATQEQPQPDYSIIIAHADPDGVVIINKEQELKQL